MLGEGDFAAAEAGDDLREELMLGGVNLFSRGVRGCRNFSIRTAFLLDDGAGVELRGDPVDGTAGDLDAVVEGIANTASRL
jgi:hypothetical protein